MFPNMDHKELPRALQHIMERGRSAGPRASIPARLTRPAIQADTLLLSFLSLGGPLDNRAGVRAQTNGVTSNADFRHQTEARD
ncbi:hypothetical protein [Mesorhizobium sp.]|uniref:hypothetical protein n=1 Tax=Mesorhizobium sp. TaxID=1871066 RepID=UPI000FE36B89|nr:hypothetical protein [Mesorhizobium sp.]RWN50462.1 MAG: hypothetical protein EOR98_31415 [Mesorhizobium sp.]RWN70897.1 MAG: hypothetical protein EOS01_32355 [Mesorhizobium sp.]RWN70942.1 MAG: hypothetical protein EOS02_32435 [Mesorhizobium sp.]RWN82453.1 MAG: hypothetical protein EOS04_31120 [Mesorhizobium sp.]RWO09935.1 MAG: hypothetical protein EOS15_26010 [Mesorhizobium sp.]